MIIHYKYYNERFYEFSASNFITGGGDHPEFI